MYIPGFFLLNFLQLAATLNSLIEIPPSSSKYEDDEKPSKMQLREKVCSEKWLFCSSHGASGGPSGANNQASMSNELYQVIGCILGIVVRWLGWETYL